jgi:Zn-dependent protease
MGTLKIGRIAGIDILIHWSWLAIFALLTWWLATGFSARSTHSHWSNAERCRLLHPTIVFLSVLLHELSHSSRPAPGIPSSIRSSSSAAFAFHRAC